MDMTSDVLRLNEKFAQRATSLVTRRSIRLKVFQSTMRNHHARALQFGSSSAAPSIALTGDWSCSPTTMKRDCCFVPDIRTTRVVDGNRCLAAIDEIVTQARASKGALDEVCFMISGAESAHEAIWWRDVFRDVSDMLGLRPSVIKCSVSIDAYPLIFELEEFAYILREHLTSFRFTRHREYIASMLHWNIEDPEWVAAYAPDIDVQSYVTSTYAALSDISTRRNVRLLDACSHPGVYRPEIRHPMLFEKFTMNQTKLAIHRMITHRCGTIERYVDVDPSSRNDGLVDNQIDMLALAQRVRHWNVRPDLWSPDGWTWGSFSYSIGEHTPSVVLGQFELAADTIITEQALWNDADAVISVKSSALAIAHNVLSGSF